MSERFANLKKVPEQPASRLLAAANAKLKTQIKSPANASVSTVLEELAAEDAFVDMIRLLSVALPPRECVWWACIAGRDLIGPEATSACLSGAEAWVFEPTDEQRAKLQTILETGSSGDPTAPAATAAFYAPGNLGPGEMAEHPAPLGVVSACAFGLNLKTLKLGPDTTTRFNLIIDRALDIARGGNGKVDLPEPKQETTKEGNA